MSEQSDKRAKNPSPAELAEQAGQQLWGERPSLDEVARLTRQAPNAKNSSGVKAEDAAEALGRIAGPETRAAPGAEVPQEEVAPVRLIRRGPTTGAEGGKTKEFLRKVLLTPWVFICFLYFLGIPPFSLVSSFD
jgi:hypothetical protein